MVEYFMFGIISDSLQQNTNICTILECKVFTIKALELQHVSTLCGSSSGSVHQYLYKT